MIQENEITILKGETYRCERISEGYAYLRNVSAGQGRTKKVLLSKVPFRNENEEWILPEKVKRSSTINVRTLMKGETNLQVSSDAVKFMVEWVETSILKMLSWAERNAQERGESRITAAHIFWWEEPQFFEPFGYWKEQRDYVRD